MKKRMILFSLISTLVHNVIIMDAKISVIVNNIPQTDSSVSNAPFSATIYYVIKDPFNKTATKLISTESLSSDNAQFSLLSGTCTI